MHCELNEIYTYHRFWKLFFVCIVIFWKLPFVVMSAIPFRVYLMYCVLCIWNSTLNIKFWYYMYSTHMKMSLCKCRFQEQYSSEDAQYKSQIQEYGDCIYQFCFCKSVLWVFLGRGANLIKILKNWKISSLDASLCI